MVDSEEDDFFHDGDWAEEEASDGISHDEPDSSAADDRQKHYKILTEEDIKRLLENDISTVSGVLSVPRGVASALLCHNNWSPSSVYDAWFSDADGGDRESPDPAANPPPQGSTEQTCNICYEEFWPRKMASTSCGHLFCAPCLRTYIHTAISDGAACLTLRCPEPGCSTAVTSDMVEKLASQANINKYHQYLRKSYVESSRNRKWCPAAGCGLAVEFDGESETCDVACDCSHKFCWRCAEEGHRPVDCKTMAKWVEKKRSEGENMRWIVANTKPCPKCRRPIEKNQGCNHMTCGAPCGFQFCWICSTPWGSRGHCCNGYRERREGGGEGEDAKKAKEVLMERYAHYYERWELNDKSREIAMVDLERARERCLGQKMKFVVEAWEQIVECRRVLKWSYVYGFYLKEVGKKTFFEYLQGEAEVVLERLHHFVEKEIEDEGVYVDSDKFNEFRVKLVDLTRVTSNYFENLLVALENDLVEVESSRNNKKRGRSSEKEMNQKPLKFRYY